MKKFSELSLFVQLGIFLGLAVVIVVAGEYFYLGDMIKANADQKTKLEGLEAENKKAREFKPLLNKIQVENEQLERQLANLRTAVPDEKEADAFIRMIKDAGGLSGVEIRRFTAKPVVAKELYVELPFEIDIDGSYYNVMQFFDKIGKLPRVVNIGNVMMGPTTASVKGVKKKYAYGPNETVIASCTATTFFGRETPAAAAPAATPPKR